MIPGSANPLLLAAAAEEAGAYQISRSLRFNSSDSAYLSRTASVAGNRRTWTWSGWVKRSVTGTDEVFFSAGNDSSDDRTQRARLYFSSNEILLAFGGGAGSTNISFSGPVYRDPSAWFHLVISANTNEANVSDAFKVYVNGVQTVSATSTGNVAYSSFDTVINNNVAHEIGRRRNASEYFNGYLADIHFIDGQALDPTSFTEVDATTGQLVPIEYTGSFGTNGFHLPFSDNSSAAALGTDTSGAGNDWTPNNLAVTGSSTSTTGNISLGSTPRNFYFKGLVGHQLSCALGNHVWDSSNGSSWTYRGVSSSTVTLTSTYLLLTGNTNISFTNTNSDLVTYWDLSLGEGVPSGTGSTYTWNVNAYGAQNIDSLVDTPTNGSQTDTGAGGEVVGNYCTLNPLQNGGTLVNGNLDFANLAANNKAVYGTLGVSSGKWYFEAVLDNVGNKDCFIGIAKASGVNTSSYVGATADSWGYISTNGYKYNNASGASYGASYTNGDVIGMALDIDAGTLVFYKNGSSQGTAYSGLTAGTYFPAVSCYNSSLVANFGQRPFAYTAPSGFKALCTTNLDDPVVAQPSTVMDVKLFTGNGSTQNITGLGFSPDFVWFKRRSSAFSHELFDVIRGGSNVLFSDLTAAEANNAALVTSFNSDGVSVGSALGANGSSATSAMWAWDAGSSTVTNTQGSITSSVRANASAGFSIVNTPSIDSTNTIRTAGHGLNATPEFIISKNRDYADAWFVYHKDIQTDNKQRLYLNTTSATNSSSVTLWAHTSSVIGFNGAQYVAAGNSDNLIFYCFAPVDGYSSFGSYTGNGSTDGPFVFTGMRPRWLLIKESSGVDAWHLLDSARLGYNADNAELYPNTSAGESNNSRLDLLSNGFKLRTSFGSTNQSGATYIYAAFAESPFKTARAR